MRWNCPHCGVNLALSDEKLSPTWSFSRCYQCSGYALVRSSDTNAIKVDRAPVGEEIILPEAREKPMLSREAAQNLASFTGYSAGPSRPVVKPAQRRSSLATTSPAMATSSETQVIHEFSRRVPSFPVMPPELNSLRDSLRDARPPVQRPLAGPDAPTGATVDRSSSELGSPIHPFARIFPEPLPEAPAQPSRLRLFPIAVGILGAIALGSGIYLLTQEQVPARSDQSSHAVRAIQKTSVGYSDQVRSQAMAPERPPERVQTSVTPKAVQLSTENPPLIVQPREKNTHIRSGPGMVYPVVGNARENVKYVVTDWSDRWFKVLPQEPAKARNVASEEQTGWIRTDAVQVLSN